MRTNTAHTIVAVFPDEPTALRAIDELRRRGFGEDQIGFIAKSAGSHHAGHTGLPNDPTDSRWEEGSGIGAAVGAATGLGLGAAVAAGVFPPLGLIAGGTWLALLASAGTGAATGAVAGAMVGLGIPEEDARAYEAEIQAGRPVVTVRTDEREVEALGVIHRHAGTVREEQAVAATADVEPSRCSPPSGTMGGGCCGG